MGRKPLQAQPVPLLIEHHASLKTGQRSRFDMLLGIEGNTSPTKSNPHEALIALLGSKAGGQGGRQDQMPDSHAVLQDEGGDCG
jgi:hypothetical protein